MPVFNQLLAARYAEALRRVLGAEIHVDSVAPEIMPVFGVEQDPFEFWLHKRKRAWIQVGNVPAAATFRSGSQIWNPSPDIVTVVLVARVRTLTASQLVINRDVTKLPGFHGAMQARDGRGNNATTQFAHENDQASFLGTNVWGATTLANTWTDVGLPPFLLYPVLSSNIGQQGMNFWNSNVNEALDYAFAGYEVPIFPEEIKE